LVVDYSTNWYSIFKGTTLSNGEIIKVEQAEWSDIDVEFSSTKGAVVFLKASLNPLPFSTQKEERIIQPDFMLIRNFPTDLHSKDYKTILMGLLMANIPAVNSLESIFYCMHRPLVYGELLKVQKSIEKLSGTVNGPQLELIPLYYYTNSVISHQHPDLVSGSSFPSVIKVGSTHAGYGKLKVNSKSDFDDAKCVLALGNDYYTTEPLIDKDYEYRIQKIGQDFRCFRRNSSTCWKGNWGNLTFEDHPVEDSHKLWANNCSKMFGGLDIFALDVIHTKDGHDIILEINDSSFGLMWKYEDEDKLKIKRVVLEKMNHYFVC